MEQELSSSGFTMITNDVNDLLPKMGMSTFGIYYVLIRDSIGRGDIEVSKSLRRLARQCGCSLSTAQRAVRKLQRLGFIKVVKNGFQQLRFSIEGLKRSVDRGYQFTRQFLMRFGIAMKIKKPKPSVLKTSTGCTQFDHTAVLNLTTYKDRKNLKNSPSGKLENSSPLKQGQEPEHIAFASKLYKTILGEGRYGYSKIVSECGGSVAAGIIKLVGWQKILNSPPYLQAAIQKELQQATWSVLTETKQKGTYA